MQKIFDLVLIGSGPVAVAALAALPKGLNIAIATGDAAAEGKKLFPPHAKIQTEALIRGESSGIANQLPFNMPDSGQLFNTAVVGGLANYWGQQFIRYEEYDPWSREVFLDYEDYLQTCSKVEALFTCSTGKKRGEFPLLDTYEMCAPRLLIGSKAEPNAGLFAMRRVFKQLAEIHQARLHHDQALRIESGKDHVHVQLADGTKLIGRRVLLAAGAIGSLRLTLTSCPDARSVRLTDHAPKMYYFWDRTRLLRRGYSDSLDHFNSLTLERVDSKRVRLFASLYRMSKASIGLVLASLGMPPFLARTRFPRIVDLITPMQIWTEASQMHYQIEQGAQNAQLVHKAPPVVDNEILQFEGWLSEHGKVLHRSSTPPGAGFHYHAGEISRDGLRYQKVSEFIQEHFKDQVLCIDASAIAEVGVRPHTLTAMASAYKVIHHVYSNKGE